MNKRLDIVIGLTLLFLLLGAAGLTQAQGPEIEGVVQPQGSTGVTTIAPGALPVQGQLTDASGNPLNGTYTVTFRIYDAEAASTPICSDVRPVSVQNGLFSDYIDHCYTSINGQKLWLGVQVEGDTEMTPRRVIYPVAYALSLVPGATISYSRSSAILTVRNSGSAEGVLGIGTPGVLGQTTGFGSGVIGQAGLFGAGVKGEGNPLAYGGWFTNTLSGTALRAESDGAALQLGGSGRIESTADSYIFVPGSALVREQEDDTTRWFMQANGSALVWRGATAGNKYIHIPITLPGVLYGQQVTIKSVTIYYKCENGANNYITATDLHKQTDADSFAVLASETTNRTSITASSYTLTPTSGNVLSSSQGILMLRLYLNFVNDTDSIQIGGVRVQLGHS
jgi:hypothetical protein